MRLFANWDLSSCLATHKKWEKDSREDVSPHLLWDTLALTEDRSSAVGLAFYSIIWISDGEILFPEVPMLLTYTPALVSVAN